MILILIRRINLEIIFRCLNRMLFLYHNGYYYPEFVIEIWTNNNIFKMHNDYSLV